MNINRKTRVFIIMLNVLLAAACGYCFLMLGSFLYILAIIGCTISAGTAAWDV